MKNKVKEGLRGVIETVRDRGNYLAFKAKEFLLDERGMGTVEVILIIVGICRPLRRCILCGNSDSRF
jgi:hypothetical protein